MPTIFTFYGVSWVLSTKLVSDIVSTLSGALGFSLATRVDKVEHPFGDSNIPPPGWAMSVKQFVLPPRYLVSLVGTFGWLSVGSSLVGTRWGSRWTRLLLRGKVYGWEPGLIGGFAS